MGGELGTLAEELDHAAGATHHSGQTAQPDAQVNFVRFPLGGGQFGLLWWFAPRLVIDNVLKRISTTNASAWTRRSFPDGVFGIIPGSSTTTLRGRTSTSATTS